VYRSDVQLRGIGNNREIISVVGRKCQRILRYSRYLGGRRSRTAEFRNDTERLERDEGIEPSPRPWQGRVLPLYESREKRIYIYSTPRKPEQVRASFITSIFKGIRG
jgi:hypothetical protein